MGQDTTVGVAFPTAPAPAVVRAAPAKKSGGRDRFPFIDQFRGMVGVMMALGHSSGFFNGAWKSLDMFDPLFNNSGQFALRYMGYLCAPGFLMMNGAVSWFSFTRRRAAGASLWQARWHLIQRGLFLILMQITWVNAAWVGFRAKDPLPLPLSLAIGAAVSVLALRMKQPLALRITLAVLTIAASPILLGNLPHIGIIACIGLSMVMLTFFQHLRWQYRLTVGLGTFVAHVFLLMIPYKETVVWQRLIMQTFVDAGDWNKYPVLPWFGLATMGSVMATGWFGGWSTVRKRVLYSWGIGLSAIAVAFLVRELRGWGNLTDFDRFPQISFFLDCKYPPNLFHNLWFFGTVCCMVGTIHLIGQFAMPLVRWLGGIGRVPFFFYCVHISLLSILADRLHFYYRHGAVRASLVGWVVLVAVMYPLALWFWRVKSQSKTKIIQLM